MTAVQFMLVMLPDKTHVNDLKINRHIIRLAQVFHNSDSQLPTETSGEDANMLFFCNITRAK